MRTPDAERMGEIGQRRGGPCEVVDHARRDVRERFDRTGREGDDVQGPLQVCRRFPSGRGLLENQVRVGSAEAEGTDSCQPGPWPTWPIARLKRNLDR